jgi:hypothetical protein
MSAHINIFILPLPEMHLHPFVNGHGVHGGIGAGHAAQIGEQFFPHLGNVHALNLVDGHRFSPFDREITLRLGTKVNSYFVNYPQPNRKRKQISKFRY